MLIAHEGAGVGVEAAESGLEGGHLPSMTLAGKPALKMRRLISARMRS
jgi:hypothetical protein